MSIAEDNTRRPLLDAVGRSIVWRIRDAARYLGTIVPMMTSSRGCFGDDYDEERFQHRLLESMTPQRMNRLLVAHSVAEDGFKFLIRRNGVCYPKTHNLMALLNKLRACDPSTAKWLDDAFAAVTAFYGTDISDPDHRHLASLSAYLEKVGDREHFELMRYLELESSVYDPDLQNIYIEFHHEILCALDEAIQPRYGTISERVEELARIAFLDTPILESLALHGETAKEAYLGWLEKQDSYVEAIRKLTGCPDAIGDQDADRVASSVCYKLTGHEDLALQSIAHGLVLSEPIQQGEIVTRVHRPDEMRNRKVATPAGDVLGYMRPWPTGFWLTTTDPSRHGSAWFRTERDARLYLARMFFGELSIITERGRSHYQACSKRTHRTPQSREGMSLHDFNWIESNTGEVLLRLWETRHGLQAGEYIKIDLAARASRGDLYRCGHVTSVAGHVVYLRDTELRHLPSEKS